MGLTPFQEESAKLESNYKKLESLYGWGTHLIEWGLKKNNRARISQGIQQQCSAIAQAKHLSSKLGRLKKRQKHRDKTTKVVTLTEINGEPWRVLVPK